MNNNIFGLFLFPSEWHRSASLQGEKTIIVHFRLYLILNALNSINQINILRIRNHCNNNKWIEYTCGMYVKRTLRNGPYTIFLFASSSYA